MLLISSLTFCIDSRKWSVISVPLKFVEVCFMAYDMVYVVTCFVDAWKEWIFCCYWVVCSINVDIILLEMVLRLTMWPSLTPWRGGLVIAEQWWKSLLLSRIPLIPPQKKVDEVPLYTWVEVRCRLPVWSLWALQRSGPLQLGGDESPALPLHSTFSVITLQEELWCFL